MNRAARFTLTCLCLAAALLQASSCAASRNGAPDANAFPDEYATGTQMPLGTWPSRSAPLRRPHENSADPPFGPQRPPPPAAVTALQIDWTETHQTIVGFGGTLSWIHPAPENRREVFDILFHQLGASVLRVQALGAETGDEGSLEPVNDDGDPNTFNWARLPIQTTEAKNAILIAAAQSYGVKTIVPTAWSPPGWMKTNNSRVNGSLKPDQLDEYAECWAAYLLGMRRQFHLSVPYISPQNEPDLTYIYPTCAIDETLYAAACAKIAARLKKEGLATQVIGPDTCRIYHLEDYLIQLDRAHVSPTLPALTHFYDLSIPFDVTIKDRERWDAARTMAARFHRPLWEMECSNYLSSKVAKGSYDEALIWAQHLHWALAAGDCQAVCFWSLFFDKKGEALIFCPKTDDPHYEILPVFYTSMNYFRAVRPGMVRCSATTGDPTLLVTAYRTPIPCADDRRVIVVINLDAAPRPIRWNNLAPPPSTSDSKPSASWSACVTDENTHCRHRIANPTGTTLPPRSVTTLVLNPPPDPARRVREYLTGYADRTAARTMAAFERRATDTLPDPDLDDLLPVD